MNVKELKEELQLSGTDTLNVFFASNSVREELAGVATWPWAKEALTHQGQPACLPSFPPSFLPTYLPPNSAISFLFIHSFVSVFAPHPFLSALVVYDPNEMGRAIEVGRDFPSSLLIVPFLFQSSFLLLNGENPSTQQQPNKQMMVGALHLPCLLDSCCLFIWAMHFFLVPVQSSKWRQM